MKRCYCVLPLVIVGLTFSGCGTNSDVAQNPDPSITVNSTRPSAAIEPPNSDEPTSPNPDKAASESASPESVTGLAAPVRLESDGQAIDIGALSNYAHAGPAIGDIDGDGDLDLVVGDFPGNFWVFENEATDENPSYVSRGMLQAGGEDAKTPVY